MLLFFSSHCLKLEAEKMDVFSWMIPKTLYYGKVVGNHHFHLFSQNCLALDLPGPNLTSRFPMWEIVSQKNGWTLESGGSSTCTFIIDFLQRGTEESHGFFFRSKTWIFFESTREDGHQSMGLIFLPMENNDSRFVSYTPED